MWRTGIALENENRSQRNQQEICAVYAFKSRRYAAEWNFCLGLPVALTHHRLSSLILFAPTAGANSTTVGSRRTSGGLEDVPHDIEIQLKLPPVRFPYHLLNPFPKHLLVLL